MPLDLPEYSNLNEMYSGPLAARMAQDNYDQKGRLAQMLLQQQQQTNDQTALTNPIEVQRQQAVLDEHRARLPGIYMDNAERGLKLDKASRTHEDEIDNLLQGYKGKHSQDELAQITRAGEAYNQVGAYLKNLPPAIAPAAAKQMLGGYWRPEFDGMDPQTLVNTIGEAGKWMTSAQTKYQQAMLKQDDQQAARLKEIEAKATKAAELARFKASIVKTTAPIAKTNDPKNWQDASTRLRMAAASEPDDAKREVLNAQAQVFDELIMTKERQKAQAAAETKASLPGMGIETNPSVPTPKVVTPGPKPATQPAPVANNPIMKDPNMAKLPQGTKALGNGVYQLPDGRKVKAN